jgi:hypothetical protein
MKATMTMRTIGGGTITDGWTAAAATRTATDESARDAESVSARVSETARSAGGVLE